MDKVIEIKEEVTVGNIILEKGDKIEVLKEEIDEDILRYLPTFNNTIKLQLRDTRLKILVSDDVSAPPLTTEGVAKAGKRLLSDMELFVDDVSKQISLQKSNINPYVFVTPLIKEVRFTSEISFQVKREKEIKSLELLQNLILNNYKKAETI